VRTLPCRVVQVERLTEDVVRLQLKLPDTERCAWRSPGFAIDWSRELATSASDYYRWNELHSGTGRRGRA